MLKMTIEGVTESAPKTYFVELPPHQVQRIGTPVKTVGDRSVIFGTGLTFDSESQTVALDIDNVWVLNLGTTSETLIIHADSEDAEYTKEKPRSASEVSYPGYGAGDSEFLRLVNVNLTMGAKQAAIDLLEEVRKRWPGDLQRGQRMNFKNTPDNFWYVIVQPRAQNLSITVRGGPNRFKPSALELKDDRPGYTRFYVNGPGEVPEALKIIEASRRK